MKDIEKEIQKYIDMIKQNGNQDIIEEIILSLQSYLNRAKKKHKYSINIICLNIVKVVTIYLVITFFIYFIINISIFYLQNNYINISLFKISRYLYINKNNMKRTNKEVFADILLGIENITLEELHNNIDYHKFNYVFEDYFDSKKYSDEYEDLYYCIDINQYVTILKIVEK